MSPVVSCKRFECRMYFDALCAMSRMRYSMSAARATATLSRRFTIPSVSATSLTESFGYTDMGIVLPNAGGWLMLGKLDAPVRFVPSWPVGSMAVADKPLHRGELRVGAGGGAWRKAGRKG